MLAFVRNENFCMASSFPSWQAKVIVDHMRADEGDGFGKAVALLTLAVDMMDENGDESNVENAFDSLYIVWVNAKALLTTMHAALKSESTWPQDDPETKHRCVDFERRFGSGWSAPALRVRWLGQDLAMFLRQVGSHKTLGRAIAMPIMGQKVHDLYTACQILLKMVTLAAKEKL